MWEKEGGCKWACIGTHYIGENMKQLYTTLLRPCTAHPLPSQASCAALRTETVALIAASVSRTARTRAPVPCAAKQNWVALEPEYAVILEREPMHEPMRGDSRQTLWWGQQADIVLGAAGRPCGIMPTAARAL